jgi:hypothetical protein
MARLTGGRIGLFPQWRLWGPTAGVAELLSPEVVVLSPGNPGGDDPVAAVAALETAVAHARRAFPHVLLDLAGLPLRHPPTLACADVLVTVAASGGVREEHLLALGRLLPDERNLGVMLID